MEKKMVKDTTKEDHYIEIAVGFKIIYNQNQYLAYIEVPKKKKDVSLEIYIGRVSILKDQYLLFKCETESERNKVFNYFKQVFSGEINNEIEMQDFSMIERISVVSSDQFDEKKDQYPNFFTLPKKEEEISANITLPSFLMKKSSKIKEKPEEIQFVGNSDEVLTSNVEVPINAEEQVSEPSMPSSEPTQTIVSNDESQDVQAQVNTVPTTEDFLATPESEMSTPLDTNSVQNDTVPVEPTEQESIDIEAPEISIEQTPIEPTEISIEQTPIEPTEEAEEMPLAPINEVATPISPINNITEPINEEEAQISSVQPTLVSEPVVEEPTVKFEQISGADIKPKKEKKNGNISIIILMIITILLIASVIVIYIFVLEPKMKEEKPKEPEITVPEAPKTSNLVCTIEKENEEDNTTESNTITFTYDNTTKNILTSSDHSTVTMKDSVDYMERKAMIKIFSQELKTTEGQKYTFKYDDKKFIYQVFIERNYEKATSEEKDENWKATYDEANEYYLDQGYTCNGITKEILNEVNLASTTGQNTVNYNNWVITYQKAILSEDKTTLSVTLEVKNKTTEKRALNGELKLFDRDNKNLRNIKLNQEIEPDKETTIVVDIPNNNESKNAELGSLEVIDFENVVSYLIELYR